jgi:predicted transcriptional regulator YdeE
MIEVAHNKVKLGVKRFVGITVRTENAAGKAGIDCHQLWTRWMEGELHEKIQNRVEGVSYGVYFDYESDHNGPFTYMVAVEVDDSVSEAPEGFELKVVPETEYALFQPRGKKFPDGLMDGWQAAWSSDLNRTFSTDFERYSEKFSFDTVDCEGVDLYIGVKS